MAAFLVRALNLTDQGTTDFTDDNTSIFEDDIEKLAAAGITQGCNPPTNDRFCPDNNVTRGQMAAFLHRGMTSTLQKWSDPSTWGGSVPGPGDVVTIAANQKVLLDVSPPELGGLMVEGELQFANKDLELRTEYILVMGRFAVGSASAPFIHDATITLTGDDPSVNVWGADVMAMGTKVLGVLDGGVLDLHGQTNAANWTQLAATAPAGSSEINLVEAPGWRVGDEVVIAPTGFDLDEAERRTVAAISGSTVTLDKPLDYEHWGELQTYGGVEVDERAEVGLLSHNVKVRGDAGSDKTLFGGHIMAMRGSTARITNTELVHMGQAGILARYPFHLHLAGDMSGSYFRSNSIHDSFQRCVTVHGTHNTVVADNVAYEALGHCYFLEDGIETGNVFDHNLGLSIREPDPDDELLPSDTSFRGPSVFWITNPDNTFTDNAAAGSEGTGFWIALPEHPTGPSTDTSVWPRRTPLGTFANNVAHSNRVDGLHVDNGPGPDGNTGTTSYRPVVNPQDAGSDSVTARFVDFTAYKNRNRGIWLRGRDHVMTGAVIADNLIGATFASNDSYLEDSVVVGETANSDGEPPKPYAADFPIRGFEFYDGTVGVRNTFFDEFVTNGQRGAGALSQLHYTDFHVSSANFASGLTFGSGTNRVWLETRPVPTDPDDGEDGYRSTVILDVDGSVTGTADNYVVVDNDFLLTGSCALRTEWGAWVCPNYYADFGIQNRDSNPDTIGPVTITRDDAETHTMLGTPNNGPNKNFFTSLLEARSYDVAFSGAAPDHLRLRMTHVVPGDWAIITLPMAGADVYRDYYVASGQELPEFGSLAELEASTGDGVYSSGGDIHVKLYVRNDRDYAVLDLCTASCT